MTHSTLAAFEHHGQPIERQRFYELACDPQRSVAVEACAGAGKTWMLVSRMVRALLEGCAPQDILAITFTKKAAGEMRQRLHDWLQAFAQADDAQLRLELRIRGLMQEPSAEQLLQLRQLHARLLQGGRPVQIRTFHSWFAALLRSAPLAVLQDLGLPAAYELLENDSQAVAQVWRRFQTRVAQDPLSHADYCGAVARYGRHQTHKALEAALNKRVEFVLADQQGVVDASVQTFAQQYPDFAALQEPADLMAQPAVRQLLLDAARQLGASKLVACTNAATRLEKALTQSAASPQTPLRSAYTEAFEALFTQKNEPRKLADKRVELDKVPQAQDTLQRIAQAQAQHEAWLHQQRMARLTRGLVGDYAALKRERGWIDMGDLERAALVLMSDPVLSGWVQERLDARVRHLLIDEFQDTNPLQWQALRAWLEGYTGAGRAPSVFIVGDPKQSIYRFRRAEPQVFKAAKAFVVDGLGGEVLSCDHTRRNAPAVIGLVNQVMAQAQAAGEFEGYRAHSTESKQVGHIYKLPRIARPLTAKQAGKENPEEQEDQGLAQESALWRDSLTTPRHLPEETHKTLECRQAAQWLAQYAANASSALPWRDIMVLARKRERLGLVQAELAALGIPAQQPEKTELADMPEVQDVVALLDVLVSPRHDLSLARALRSPLFGVSDSDLVQLVLLLRQRQVAQAEQEASLGQPAPDVLQEPLPPVTWLQLLLDGTGMPDSLVAVGESLRRWAQWVATLPPHDALSAIYQDGDVLARYAAASPPTQRESVLANLRATLMAALQVDGGRYTSAYALVRALRGTGMAAPVRSDVNAVRLLTIHGAKGLEAPLVLLLDTDGEAQKAETMGVLVDWPGEHAYPQRFVFVASESKPSACMVDALAVEQAARRREELNALYVAVTRTQHTLVVSSMEPHAGSAGSWWQRLQEHALEAPWVGASAPAGAGEVPEQAYTLKTLPNMPVALVERAQAAPKVIANSTAAPGAADSSTDVQDSLDSRIGQAMHRLLEWVAPLAGGSAAWLWTAQQQDSLALEFELTSAQVLAARQMAQTIVAGEGAWAWDSQHIQWYANEVAMAQGGRILRLDRLVQRRDTAQWWVLDYKSTSAPQQQAELCAQMHSYRAALQKAYPGQVVRAAFLTATGALIELAPPEATTLENA